MDLDVVPTADAPEIVHCEDCAVPHNRWTGCPRMNGTIMRPYDYCSYGIYKSDVKQGEVIMMSNFSRPETKLYWDVYQKKSVECIPVRHGHWVDDTFEDGEWYHTCSACGMQLRHDAFDNFCGNCGALMDEAK